MKLRNKKTGEITANYDLVAIQGIDIDKGIDRICLQTENGNKYVYNSLADFNAEWEDYEEPKKHYEILGAGIVMGREDTEDEIFRNQGQREIGNYFETEEEAEKAVEKLKAWKRLKDRGFKFTGFDGGRTYIDFTFDKSGEPGSAYEDLDLLFGGEE